MNVSRRLLAASLALVAATAAAQGDYAALRGSYAGTCTVETTSAAVGPAALRITTPGKKPAHALLEISGTVSPADTVPGTGNATPLAARLTLRHHRVQSSNYLLGLSGRRDRSQVARVRGGGPAWRFTLVSAGGTGQLRCTLRIRAGVLTLTGSGFTQPADSPRQPVKIVITAPRG